LPPRKQVVKYEDVYDLAFTCLGEGHPR